MLHPILLKIHDIIERMEHFPHWILFLLNASTTLATSPFKQNVLALLAKTFCFIKI
jgi:hypothetical protein